MFVKFLMNKRLNKTAFQVLGLVACKHGLLNTGKM
uniref:Uncharacterized protein n=1 Tax=Arundo donax TaxID=35708 RepID=A0A0A9HLB2_ARUDO